MEAQFRLCPNSIWIPQRKGETPRLVMQLLQPGFCWYSCVGWWCFIWNTGMMVTDSQVIQNFYLLFFGGQQMKTKGPRFQYIEGESNRLWVKLMHCKKWEQYFCGFSSIFTGPCWAWPPWNKANNNQPVQTVELKWPQILLLWKLPT